MTDLTYTPETMTKDERSFLLYAETCAVDYGGLLEGERMNLDDLNAAKRMSDAGLLKFGRIPSRLLGSKYGPRRTHYVELSESGWALAHLCRQDRASRRGPLAREVFEEVAAKEIA